MLELHERLDKHAVCVEHQGAVVGVLLDLSVVVQPCTAFTLERTEVHVIHLSVHASVLLKSILRALHLLIIITILRFELIILVLILLLLLLLPRLLILRILLIHMGVNLLVSSVNLLLLGLFLFLAPEYIRGLH